MISSRAWAFIAICTGIILVVVGFLSQKIRDADGTESRTCEASPWTWTSVAAGLFMVAVGFTSAVQAQKGLSTGPDVDAADTSAVDITADA